MSLLIFGHFVKIICGKTQVILTYFCQVSLRFLSGSESSRRRYSKGSGKVVRSKRAPPEKKTPPFHPTGSRKTAKIILLKNRHLPKKPCYA